jgi:diketogulonate reductase-like aldo/keto reductase
MLRRQFLHDATMAALLAGTGARRASAAPLMSQSRMSTRPIPRTAESLPVVGLGTWQTFDPASMDDVALAPLAETLRALLDAGGRVVDSSPMYGSSERVVGTLAERLRINDRLFVATKVWTTGEREGIAQMRESMRQLERERVDLMQVHNLVDWRTHLRTLRAWKEEGRIRYLGVTHYTRGAFDELERIIRNEHIDFVQLPYSLGFRAAEERLLPAAAAAGVAVLVNRPFEGGSLFSNVVRTPVPESVRAFAETWPQAFLKYVLAHDAVTCVIPGTSNPAHMRDNARAGLGRLPDARERQTMLRILG